MKNLDTFYFCLTSPKKRWLPLSVLIRWFQGTKYSHCSLNFYIQDKNPMVYDSSGLYNNLRSQQCFFKSNVSEKVWRIRVNPKQRHKILSRIYNKAGTPYGYLQVIGIAYQIVVKKLLGKRVKNPFANDYKKSICTEELARIMVEDLKTVKLKEHSFDSVDLLWLEENLNKNERFTRVK